jgi:Phage Terminase
MTALAERPVAVLGREEPRLWTAPLRPLTPSTSLGFEAIAFASDVLGVTLLPWQRWWLIHALELDADTGRYRFRTVLTLVGRQQGKTTLLKIVALWAMFLGRADLVLGAAQSLDIARESWQGAVDLAEGTPDLSQEVATVRRANGELTLGLTNGSRYRIAAATRSAGRGLSVDLLILDEIREHHDWEAWGALSKTTMARANALKVCISNAGDERSVVLNGLRSAALAESDPGLGLFEWSAPEGCALDDRDAWAQAMPGLGETITIEAVLDALATDPESVFRTELLCQHVAALDVVIDPHGWAATGDVGVDLGRFPERVVVCVDVAPDGEHVTLAAAALDDDGRALVAPVAAWDSTDAARAWLRVNLPDMSPRAFGWFPGGPGAVLGADLAAMGADVRDPDTGRYGPIGRMNVRRDAFLDWAPGVVDIAGGKVTQACQSFADLVRARKITHADDPLCNAHVAGAGRLDQGDGWRFVRRGAGHVDAAYAMAGAVHLARTLPAYRPPPRSKVF